ncbi:MAG: GNAT family N-acetyltransferase [Dehalococcoidales bacterium]|nr:GNAT family N-acetyltransferase [Dehalococcoidales bacterium]
MPDILHDLSDQALIKAIEENMYAMTPLSHGWPRTEVYTGEDVSWCLTDVAFPTCNPIIHVNLEPEAVDSLLETLITRARRRKINLHCWVTDDTRPANLGEYLTAHGFTSVGTGAGMAIDLSKMNEADRSPAGCRIVEVGDDDSLETWCRVSGTGFGIPEPAIPSIVEYFTTDIKLNQPLKFYLGILDGKPVATSMYFLGEGVVGIYFVATLEEARNRGIGYAITRKPLLEAREMGYRVGILQASEVGKPVYLKLGFKEYSRIGSYSWIYQPE